MNKTLLTLIFFTGMWYSFGLYAQGVILPGPTSCDEPANTGTWIVPTGVTSITVEVYGAGGGGGGNGGGSNGGFFYTRAGGGGGAGGFSTITIDVTPGSSFAFSVGAGGCSGDPGGDFDDGDDGSNGQNSMFSGMDADGTFISLTANGGIGGTGGEGEEGSAGIGGLGGSASGGATNSTGGNGINGNEGNHGAGGSAFGPNGGNGGVNEGAEGESYGGGAAGGGDSFGGHGGNGGILISGPNLIGVTPNPVDEINYQDDLGISISPNPAIHSMWLEFTVKQQDLFNIALLDVTGKLIRTVYNGSLNAGTQRFDLTPQLPYKSGVYLVQVQYSHGYSVSKLVVH